MTRVLDSLSTFVYGLYFVAYWLLVVAGIAGVGVLLAGSFAAQHARPALGRLRDGLATLGRHLVMAAGYVVMVIVFGYLIGAELLARRVGLSSGVPADG